jgi:hypothetical protein
VLCPERANISILQTDTTVFTPSLVEVCSSAVGRVTNFTTHGRRIHIPRRQFSWNIESYNFITHDYYCASVHLEALLGSLTLLVSGAVLLDGQLGRVLVFLEVFYLG